MGGRFEIPPEDQSKWADLLGLDEAPISYSFVCDRCKFPAIRTPGGWRHAAVADGVFCANVFGVVYPPGLENDTETNCGLCRHLWAIHDGDRGCHGKTYPGLSLTGEPCSCERMPQ